MRMRKAGIKLESIRDMELAVQRLKAGKCMFCGKERRLTPAMNLGKKCMKKMMEKKLS